MRASVELYQFCSGMTQNLGKNVATFQDWIASAISFVPKDRLPIFRDYLDQLLSGNYSDAQLEEIYNSTYSEFASSGDGGARVLFEAARNAIDGKPV